MSNERNHYQDNRLDKLEKKFDDFLQNHWPHMKGEVSLLHGKFDNFAQFTTDALGEIKERQSTHWPRSLSVIITLLTSLLAIFLTFILTSHFSE